MAKTILIVDDAPEVRRTFGAILAERGYKVLDAENGQQALGKAQREKPDVILLDTLLPDIDGYEVCRVIRRTEEVEPKIIIYTGQIDAVDAGKAREAGADDYVVKASDLSYLPEAIKNV